MALPHAIELKNWSDVRSMIQGIENHSVRQMKLYPYGNEGERVTVLHLLGIFNAPSDLIGDVLFIQSRLAKKASARGRELPLHYCVAGTCLGENPEDISSIQLIIEKYPGAVYYHSTNLGYFGAQVTPLDIALMNGAPNNVVEFLLRCRQQAAAVQRRHPVIDSNREPLVLNDTETEPVQFGTVMRKAILVLGVPLTLDFGTNFLQMTMIQTCGALLCGYGVARLLGFKFQQRDAPQTTARGRTESVVPVALPRNPAMMKNDSVEETANTIPAVGQSPGDCVVCWERVADHVLLPCGHICMCARCTLRLADLRHRCPIGNCRVQSSTRVYHSCIPSSV